MPLGDTRYPKRCSPSVVKVAVKKHNVCWQTNKKSLQSGALPILGTQTHGKPWTSALLTSSFGYGHAARLMDSSIFKRRVHQTRGSRHFSKERLIALWDGFILTYSTQSCKIDSIRLWILVEFYSKRSDSFHCAGTFET
jgi:hypothetical protein